ncbi:hypothetical protein V2J09_021188 [Rumex salicifolius]
MSCFHAFLFPFTTIKMIKPFPIPPFPHSEFDGGFPLTAMKTIKPSPFRRFHIPNLTEAGDDGTCLSMAIAELRIPSGSKYGDGNGILKDGFARMVALLHQDHLQYGIDESYNLSVPSPRKSVYARIELNIVLLINLPGRDSIWSSTLIRVSLAPWIIIDEPRFAYRGLLVDTSRHYLPLPVIKKVIDSMTYGNLNVLHWHIMDTQSFPLEIPSYLKLRYGAYSVIEQYTFADAAEIRRGMNVLAEIDVPRHASSWGVSYPTLWPSKDCKQPLDVSNEFTFKLIDGILCQNIKFKFVHLGGDEVNTSSSLSFFRDDQAIPIPPFPHPEIDRGFPFTAMKTIKLSPFRRFHIPNLTDAGDDGKCPAIILRLLQRNNGGLSRPELDSVSNSMFPSLELPQSFFSQFLNFKEDTINLHQTTSHQQNHASNFTRKICKRFFKV